MDFDWKSLVRTICPAIASVFGTPLAGLAVRTIADALLPPDAAPTATEDDVSRALQNANPDALAKLKQIDSDFKTRMKALDIDLAKLPNEDRANARAMQVSTKDWVPGILALLVTAGLFALLLLMAFHDLPAGNATLLNVIAGSLGSAWVGIISFYFGSSSGSQAKDSTLNLMASRK